MKTIGLIGCGRFGTLLARILQDDHKVIAYDTVPEKISPPLQVGTLREIASCETIFIAVPIRHFSDTIGALIPHLKKPTTVIDLCSVKVYPAKIMQEKLPEHVGILAAHPLFGPDSLTKNSDAKFLLHPLRDTQSQYHLWEHYFAAKGFEMINLTPDAHDRFAASSQGITHLLGRALHSMDIQATPIDTLGFERLRGIIQQTCNDSLVLFEDLQRYNPYTAETLTRLIDTLNKMHQTLIH